MEQASFHLVLDKHMLTKVIGYYIYRSQEQHYDRPVVDGLYIQRNTLGEYPPEEMIVSITWSSSPIHAE